MAKQTVYELLAKFTGDTSGLTKSLSTAQSSLQNFAKAALAAAGVTGIGALFASTMKQIDADAKLADSLNISIASLKAMQSVAKDAGIETEQFTGMLQIMQRSIFAAATGLGDQRDALAALHISLKEITSLSADQQFLKIAEGISKIRNPTEQAGIAALFFGRNARAVINVLDDYSEKIKAAAAFNEKWGISLSRIDAAKVEQANDALSKVKQSSEGIINVIAVQFSPAIEAMSKSIVGASFSAREFGQALSDGMDEAALLIDGIDSGFNEIENTIAIATKGITVFMAKLDPRKSADDVARLKDELHDMADEANDQTFNPSGPNMFDKLQKARSDSAAEAAKKASQETKNLGKAWIATADTMKQFRDDTAKVFADFVTSVAKGGNALDALKSKVIDVAGTVIEAMFKMSFGGTSGGGLGGVLAEGLFSAFGISFKKDAPTAAQMPTKKFAKGSAFINSSTMFPMSTGVGQAGEAGTEAIMPLSRGPDGKLGVSGSGGMTVVQNINISTGVQQTVRAEIMGMLPQISEAGVKAVQNGLNRGTVRA